MIRASVIVPVHGRAELTRRCLEVLLPALPPGCEVVVVDDASEDHTSQLLRSYGGGIRTVSLERNAGFAGACNAGAAAARGGHLVFLNNDTEPRTGWLEALLEEAELNPSAWVVGAKLLYPGGAVQHAGVVFGQDGYPHNLYAGLPGDHPAVECSRRLQAVTAACMLVRRSAFESLGGFDEGYENSLEDVDLCLRAGQAGGEVRYCAESVVVHLESASRGRRDRFERSVALYRGRWRDRVDRDDLAVYAADGLLEVEYPASYPLRLAISPRLAIVDDRRQAEIEPLLETYARQVSDLLAEVMRLTAIAGTPPALAADAAPGSVDRRTDHRRLLAEARRLEHDARQLQDRFAAASRAAGDGGSFAASESLGYRQMVEQIRAAVEERVPAGAEVIVVSRGDRELVELGERDALHFPSVEGGGYAGHHPLDSDEAISELERLRSAGAAYLLLPATAYWWLDHYQGLARHLRRYRVAELGVCSIYELTAVRQGDDREVLR